MANAFHPGVSKAVANMAPAMDLTLQQQRAATANDLARAPLHGVIGAGIGGLTAAAATEVVNRIFGVSKEKRKKRRRMMSGVGAVAGAITGAGLRPLQRTLSRLPTNTGDFMQQVYTGQLDMNQKTAEYWRGYNDKLASLGVMPRQRRSLDDMSIFGFNVPVMSERPRYMDISGRMRKTSLLQRLLDRAKVTTR